MVVRLFKRVILLTKRNYVTAAPLKVVNGQAFETDSYTNLTPTIVSHLNRNLYNQKEHPICLLKERIIQFFYNKFKNNRGNPTFSVYDDLNPVVTTQQNFDSLLVPDNHVSRMKTDSYYLNKDWLLRGHMTAHQSDLIKMGLNNFLMVGDVYRRDEIDSTHYPVFHQLDGVRLLTPEELFTEEDDGIGKFSIKQSGKPRTEYLQEVYSEKASKKVEAELKNTLEELTKDLFGNKIEFKWIDAYFPFTHPSWELEILVNDKWIEILGCGVIEHKILENGGCDNRIGWAFGLGIERLAMIYYSIPDIRFFWTTDSGFLHQFEGKTCNDKVTFKPFSVYPPAPYDLSFWVDDEEFHCNDFYDIAREHCGDVIEQIKLIDVYRHPKTGRESRCYRLVYRSMVKTFTKEELNEIHKGLVKKLVARFKIEVR